MRGFPAAALLLLIAGCAAAPEAEPVVRLVTLEQAPAGEVAAQLRAGLPAGVVLDVLDVPGVNGILLKGSPAQCDALTAEIRRLDRPRGG